MEPDRRRGRTRDERPRPGQHRARPRAATPPARRGGPRAASAGQEPWTGRRPVVTPPHGHLGRRSPHRVGPAHGQGRQRSARMTGRARASRRDQGLRHPHDHAGPVPALPSTAACRRCSAPTHRDLARALPPHWPATSQRRSLAGCWTPSSCRSAELSECSANCASATRNIDTVRGSRRSRTPKSGSHGGPWLLVRSRRPVLVCRVGDLACCHRPQCDGGACRLLVLGGNIADC
jgi:hypothetical protein